MLSWRKFPFFDADMSQHELEKSATCATSGQNCLVLGDAEGNVSFFDRTYKTTTFRAFDFDVLQLAYAKNRNTLLTLGRDESQPVCIKLWTIAGIDEPPQLARTLKLFSPNNEVTTTTCLAVSDDLDLCAVGLGNGGVMLFRGDLLKSSPKQKVLSSKSGSPVTGLGVGPYRSDYFMYVTTTDSVCVYYHPGVSKTEEKTVFDESEGAGAGFTTMSEDGEGRKQDFLVARKEVILAFHPGMDQPAVQAFDMVKKCIYWFKRYLVVVTVTPHRDDVDTLTILDTENKFVAYSQAFLGGIRHLVTEWGSLIVITQDRQVHLLCERDLQGRLDHLFRKNAYGLAVKLTRSAKGDNSALLSDLYRKYGDHLYNKGDYDGAMDQYVQTIGRLEPSYVIRKYLDAQRIKNLTAYLQSLHEKNVPQRTGGMKSLATADHTTLLLNCYTKLRDVSRLEDFIGSDSVLNLEEEHVTAAIRVCRSAGYYRHAQELAKRVGDHEAFIKVQIEDLHGYTVALRHIQTLPFEDAEKHMQKYGKTLVAALPEETTALLIRLCTGYTPTPVEVIKREAGATSPRGPTTKATILSRMMKKGKDEVGDDPRPTQHTPPPASAATTTNAVATAGEASKKAPAETFIHIFVEQPGWLLFFLEAIVAEAQRTSGPTSLNSAVFNTLLELYLRDDIPYVGCPLSKEERSDRALNILRGNTELYDMEHALVLVKTHNFGPGILYLLEKLHLYREIMTHYMEHDMYSQVIRACKKYGDEEPMLWKAILWYFASKPDCEAQLKEVLDTIEEDNLMPPLLVVQILAHNEKATLGTIKPFLVRKLKEEYKHIQTDGKQIKHLQQETQRMRAEIADLETSAQVFQSSKCAVCRSDLDTPSVHFLCKHAYHQRCLSDDKSCVKCAADARKIQERRRALQAPPQLHDKFEHQLSRTADGFAVIAEYFGRGLFNKSAQSANDAPVVHDVSAILDLDVMGPTSTSPTFNR